MASEFSAKPKLDLPRSLTLTGKSDGTIQEILIAIQQRLPPTEEPVRVFTAKGNKELFLSDTTPLYMLLLPEPHEMSTWHYPTLLTLRLQVGNGWGREMSVNERGPGPLIPVPRERIGSADQTDQESVYSVALTGSETSQRRRTNSPPPPYSASDRTPLGEDISRRLRGRLPNMRVPGT